MTSIWRKLAGLIPGLTAMASPSATAADSDAAQAWLKVYDARQQFTDEEMNWSIKNGREALLARLQAAGVGQVSTRKRTSVA